VRALRITSQPRLREVEHLGDRREVSFGRKYRKVPTLRVSWGSSCRILSGRSRRPTKLGMSQAWPVTARYCL